MNDLIDRQAAIDTVRSYMADNWIEDSDWHANGIAYEIKRLPSAQPKKGRWIPCKEYAREMLTDKTVNILYDHYECSLCRCTLPNLLYNQDGEPFYKFCPNCGAKMGGDAK